MLNLEQLLGLYLALAWVTVAVVGFQLWSRGSKIAGLALVAAPLAVWGLFEASTYLPEFHRCQLGIGLFPALLGLLLVPFAWLYSIAPSTEQASWVDQLMLRVPPLLIGNPKVRLVLWAVSAAGVAWFAYGLFHFQSSCDFAALTAGQVDLRQSAVFVSSALGLWPLLLGVTLITIVAASRPMDRSSR